MSQNLSDVTGELSRSAKPKRLDNTFANIEQTTKKYRTCYKEFGECQPQCFQYNKTRGQPNNFTCGLRYSKYKCGY